MLTKRYMTSLKNVPDIMSNIIEGAPPSKFSVDHLKGLGFKSSNDRAIIPLLKDLGFLTDDGTPTGRYHAYRDRSQSKQVMGEAIKDAYSDLFLIREELTESDRQAVIGKFKSTHGSTDKVASLQAATFFCLLKLADLKGHSKKATPTELEEKETVEEKTAKNIVQESPASQTTPLHLRYNIEVHLPATKDIEVYNAIFKSLKENLIDQ